MERFAMDELLKASAKLSAEEMEHLCSIAGIGLFNLNVGTGNFMLNSNLTNLCGYEPGELPHSRETKLMLTYESDRPRLQRCLESVLGGEKEQYALDYRMRRKDGSLVYVYECAIVAERDASGQVLRLAGLGMDLSKQQWAEEKARVIEEKNRQLTKMASESRLLEQNRLLRATNQAAAMIIGGLHHEYSVVLQQSLQILGECLAADRAFILRNTEVDGRFGCYHRVEWARKDASIYMGTDHVFFYDDFMPGWEEIITLENDRRSITAQLSSAFMRHINFKEVKAMMVIPLFLNGEFWGLIGFDDCEHERAFTDDECEIIGSGALVIASSISRNEAFAKLDTARRNEKASNRAKGDFLSRMSHEIRTPMNAIIGMTTIAKRTDDPARIQYCLEKVDSSSRQLLGLINDILDMSKIEADKLEIDNAEFDFEKMIQYVINMMQVKLDEKHQTLCLDMEHIFDRKLISDELRLSQVLINLLSNAIKFTPVHGRITLKIREKDDANGNAALHIEVIDTGIGVDPDKKDKLFESFEQADGSISRQYGGTGLGLAISKKIVTLLGGDIWVESVLGEGSSFIFEIAAQWGEKLKEDLITVIPEEMRILVVDDKEDVLEYFANIMEGFSVSCDTAISGKDAIELVRRSIEEDNPYDIVFIDWNMPGLSGGETAREIRAIGGDNIVYVMISVSEWCDIEKEAKSYGVTNFLAKPVLPSVLYNTILELTNNNLIKPRKEVEDVIPDWSSKHILLAEDIEINREIVASILGETSVQLTFAEDGQQAFDHFMQDEVEYDLILMDVQMPSIDGLEATRMIRKSGHPRAKSIPIIAMTANAFKEDAEECMEAGMNAHVAKPIDVDALYRVLREHIGKE